MDKMWTFYSSVILLSVIQIQHVFSTGCDILSVVSPSASTLNVQWTAYTSATNYLLDLRIVNSTNTAAVMVMAAPPSTQRVVQGLRPGQVYQVKLKAMIFYDVVCQHTVQTRTVPGTPLITYSRAVSSTSLKLEWTSMEGADSYTLFVEEFFVYPIVRYNRTFTATTGVMDGLIPTKTYNCYVTASNSAGQGTQSNTKTVTTLVQPPTGVHLVSAGRSTADLTWNSVTKVLLYQVRVTDIDNPSNLPVIRNTSATTMLINNLEPCSTYTVGVSSLNMFLEPGEPSDVNYTTSTINPVTTVNVDYSCSTKTVTVTWDLVFGANSYLATAVDGSGASLNCSSASTSCQIVNLNCGETYQVHVTAISDDCSNTSTVSATFETVPCAPVNLQTEHTCSSNVIIFSWGATNRTIYYVATATDNTGAVTECRTPDVKCYFTNIACGQVYTYKVYAISYGCNSEISESKIVQTSPCLPSNVRTAHQCDPDKLITTWDHATGAQTYTVRAEGNTGDSYNCTSANNSCAVTGIPCGEHLTVWITASNDNCTTNRVLGEVAQTVPCIPTNVSVSVDCSPNSARVNWTTSNGAIFHIAVAHDTNGSEHSCRSSGSNCLIEGLQCGRNYNASVIGTNMVCNSTSSQVSFMTAPCPPTSVQAIRDCDANQAVIKWRNLQLTGNYTAILVDQTGVQRTCSSDTVLNCTVASLPCGMTYNVTVTYHNDGHCPSVSLPIRMDSVPCGPENVTASVTCVTGELTVAWNISAPAENYTAIISGGGQTVHCSSTQTQCTAEGLPCGSSYGVKVYSITGSCNSLLSSEITVQTLPCPPTNVAATGTCSPHPVPVSWVSSASATHYTVVAVSGGGQRSECSTNSTSCSLPGLQCGERYTIGVSGVDDACRGAQSNTVALDTEPCPPSNVSSQLMCSAGTAELSWAPSANAVSYDVRAVSSVHTLNCTSSSPNCTLSNLVCGPMYQISVAATDGNCTSNYSAAFTQDPVPCAPQNITADLQCATNDLTVSWTLSAGPLNYSVSAVPLSGNLSSLSCHTDGSSCSLTALPCGQTFNVSVKASSGSCCGPWSSPQTVQTAPCPPQGLTAEAPCGTHSLLASWNACPDATSYTATVTGPDGFSDTCSSSTLNCSVAGLQCASQYNVSVTSGNGRCSSAPSRTVITTGPCDPVNVTSNFHCATDMATVSWDSAAGALAYTAVARDGGAQTNISCRTGSTSCQLSQLQCGTTYNLTVVAEDNMCNSTGGTGGTLTTAPCSPSILSSAPVCGTNTSLVTWTSMSDATGYTVNATTAAGHRVLCSSVNSSCALSDLQCSETYTASVVAKGSGCDSAPGPSADFTTAPCPPAFTTQRYDCDANTATFGWTEPAGSVSYQAWLTGNAYQDSCNTTNASCVFQNLPCDLDFNVTLRAQGINCTSPPAVSGSLRTVPCAPQNVSGALVCLNHSAQVTWTGSPFAVGYNVTMTGQDTHTHRCYTNSTTCSIPDIHCGETYSITVTPRSDTCPGGQSSPLDFSGGLCAPSNVTASPSCEDNTVSWSPVAGADMFVATATADDGHTHTCGSNVSNSCNFTGLRCGEAYSVTVVTVDSGCSSEPSAAAVLRTALCPSTNLTSQVNCDTNDVTLTWDPSPESGVTYTLQSERLGSGLPPTEETTPNTSHTFTNMSCGQRYAFRIKAQDAHCQSSYSPSTEISTGPCPPTNFTARVDCGTNRANFSWAESVGAGLYTVEVTGEHGHVASCSSNDTSCAVKLHCGRAYAAALVASTDNCTNTQHADIHFDSAPCLPNDVVADVDCDTNVMNVTWAQTTGSDTYTAMAISGDGHNVSCDSTSNSCSIHHLRCGRVYEVAVTTSSIHCGLIGGSDYRVQSAPCKPENTTVEQNCSSNTMTVQWEQSGTNQNYTVTATSAAGANSTCDTSQTSCPFLNLGCGQDYTFTVTGYTNVCMSDMSTVNRATAPCPPTNASAELNCTTHNALVSWSSAAASTGYSVRATSANGHVSTCSDMGTSCHLSDLVCGQQYSVVVEAMNTGCAGPASAPVMLTTEPCVPTNLSVHYNVSTNGVSWSAASGASSYSVEAVTDQGPVVGCNTSSTSCSLSGLQCGQIYNVTVTAHNQACDSRTSEIHQLTTEPCPPTNVQTNVACEQLSATVSWVGSILAVGYVVFLDNQSGHSTSCSNTDTQCTVSGLSCGTAYDVRVKALGQEHNSSDSTVVSAASGPCKPSGIDATMDCALRSAAVWWQPSVGAQTYTAELTASSGHTASCATNHTNCQLSPLQCGEEYNVTVTAHGAGCNSTAQMSGQLITDPCVPTNLSVHYNVSANGVRWSAASGASSYSVEAVTDQGSVAACNTSSTGCSLSGLQCGQIYNVTVAAHNHVCNDTVSSEPYQLLTEPCPPNNVQASVACAQLTATASWEQSDLAVGYVAYFEDNSGHSTSCSNTDTHCTVSGLSCGTVYDIRVKALGEEHNSSDSTAVSAASAPCLPADVEVRVNCNSDGAAVVSWNSTRGSANFSLATTVGGSLQTLCMTQQNSCNVTNLACGEKYNLSLTASNEQCSVTAPMSTNLTTRPCPPQRVGVDLQCGSGTAVLSWETDSDVDLYTATAVKASGGAATPCNSTSSTCHFSSLACGEMYNFSVMAHTQSCCSQASDTVFIQTEPCQPIITLAQASCQSDQVQISWQQASGVENYLLSATGNLGYTDIYNTTQTSLWATLPCGQDYNLTIQGEGSQCNSNVSGPAFFKTPPCIPHHVTTYVQCESNTGSVSWGPSDGAESYVAVATGLDGHPHNCTTNGTACTWDDLHCGDEYTVVVRAKDGNCTSPPSNSSVIYMDPCAPQSLEASVDCSMETVSLSWDGSNGTMYMVSAEGGDNATQLTTHLDRIHFSSLTCGQTYNLMVSPHSQHCPSNSSATASIQTWPCPPTGISATQNCLSDNAVVTWQASNGSNYYTVTMETDTGLSETSTSTSNQKSFAGLTCGHNFTVSVTASNQQCNTTSSETASLQTIPCVPTNVSVEMDCVNNTALVSWSASRGASEYSVMASGSHGNLSCQSSGLSCRLNNPTCGSNYTVQVAAMDDRCSSVPSQAVLLNSGPCPPHNVSAQINCSNNGMTVSWDAIRDADHFLVSAVADGGAINRSCNTADTRCSISNVACGKTFSVHVTSVRGSCSSQHSQTHTVLSAPCRPQGIRGNLDCVTNSAWISWDAAEGADSYAVSAAGGDDHATNCTTSTNTTCEVQDLECGAHYNFTVTAKNSRCESPPSGALELQTAPCSLSAITAVAQCHNSSILVMWDLMDGDAGDTLYNVTAEASDHTYLSCSHTGTSCYLQGAECGLRYTIIVAASSDQCSSMRSPPLRISMEPCPPGNVTVDHSCADNSALVSWAHSPITETYTVSAVGADGRVHTCNTTSNNCSMTDLQCGRQYEVSVTARHENCTSGASPNTTLVTGPCRPGGVSVTYHCTNQSAVLTWTPSANALEYFGRAQSADGGMVYCDSTGPSCTIEGLDCGTAYNFSVRASDGTCNSSFSVPVERGAVPCPPEDLAVQELPAQMARQVLGFSWTQVSCGNPQYMLELKGDLLGDNETQFDLSSYWTNSTYYEVPLPCGSSYKATLKSRNDAGTGETSVPLSGTTAPCAPSGVQYSGNNTFATITWEASVHASVYTVYENTTTPWTQLCRVVGLSCSLSNITSSSLVITASNAAGEGEAEHITNVIPHSRRRRHLLQVESEGLSAPVLTAEVKTPTVVLLVWTSVEDAYFYDIVSTKQDGSSEPEEYIVEEEYLILTDMTPNSNYCFTATAASDSDRGPGSEAVCVQT